MKHSLPYRIHTLAANPEYAPVKAELAAALKSIVVNPVTTKVQKSQSEHEGEE